MAGQRTGAVVFGVKSNIFVAAFDDGQIVRFKYRDFEKSTCLFRGKLSNLRGYIIVSELGRVPCFKEKYEFQQLRKQYYQFCYDIIRERAVDLFKGAKIYAEMPLDRPHPRQTEDHWERRLAAKVFIDLGATPIKHQSAVTKCDCGATTNRTWVRCSGCGKMRHTGKGASRWLLQRIVDGKYEVAPGLPPLRVRK